MTISTPCLPASAQASGPSGRIPANRVPTKSIAMTAAAALRDLSFREVRNLEDLGDLQRFPRLRRLQVSDQPKVAELHVGRRNDELEHLYLYSMPGLYRL